MADRLVWFHLQVLQFSESLHVQLKVFLWSKLRRSELAQHSCRESESLPEVVVILYRSPGVCCVVINQVHAVSTQSRGCRTNAFFIKNAFRFTDALASSRNLCCS